MAIRHHSTMTSGLLNLVLSPYSTLPRRDLCLGCRATFRSFSRVLRTVNTRSLSADDLQVEDQIE